jgi:hypothetical protein
MALWSADTLVRMSAEHERRVDASASQSSQWLYTAKNCGVADRSVRSAINRRNNFQTL